jgi:hypothetical protein
VHLRTQLCEDLPPGQKSRDKPCFECHRYLSGAGLSEPQLRRDKAAAAADKDLAKRTKAAAAAEKAMTQREAALSKREATLQQAEVLHPCT